MKIAIVVAAILLAAWAAVLAIRPDLFRPALVRKSDIYGFVPGMPLEDVNKLITQQSTAAANCPMPTSSIATSTASRLRSP